MKTEARIKPIDRGVGCLFWTEYQIVDIAHAGVVAIAYSKNSGCCVIQDASKVYNAGGKASSIAKEHFDMLAGPQNLHMLIIRCGGITEAAAEKAANQFWESL